MKFTESPQAVLRSANTQQPGHADALLSPSLAGPAGLHQVSDRLLQLYTSSASVLGGRFHMLYVPLKMLHCIVQMEREMRFIHF